MLAVTAGHIYVFSASPARKRSVKVGDLLATWARDDLTIAFVPGRLAAQVMIDLASTRQRYELEATMVRGGFNDDLSSPSWGHPRPHPYEFRSASCASRSAPSAGFLGERVARTRASGVVRGRAPQPEGRGREHRWCEAQAHGHDVGRVVGAGGPDGDAGRPRCGCGRARTER
jgi:hypothetical protein